LKGRRVFRPAQAKLAPLTAVCTPGLTPSFGGGAGMWTFEPPGGALAKGHATMRS